MNQQWGVRQIVRDGLGILAFAAVLAFISWRTYERLPGVDQPRDPNLTAMCDFRDVVYYPARAAVAGVNPYNSYPRPDGRGYRDLYPAGNPLPLYGPLLLVVSLPLSSLPLPLAQGVFWLLNVILLLVLAYFALRTCGVEPSAGTVAGLGAVLLLSRPGHANLYFGQITFPMILVTLGAWNLAPRRPTVSGVLLALALIKPTYGVPLALLMLIRGNHRAAVTGLAITAVASAAILAVLVVRDADGPGMAELISQNQSHVEDDPNVHPKLSGSRIDLPMVVERALGDDAAFFARWILPFVILGVSGWHLRRIERSGGDNQDDSRKSVLSISLLCVTIAITIYHGIYDGLLATVPAVAAWHAVSRRGAAPLSRFGNLALAVCLIVPGLNDFSSKQFVALLLEFFPSLASAGTTTDGLVWAILCTINGVSLAAAWGILLFATGKLARQQRPTPAAFFGQ